MKTRATKKACGSIDTELTPDFIRRAIISNPIEILNNEALKMEFLFGGDPLPEFNLYHNLNQNQEISSVLDDIWRNHPKAISIINNLLMVLALKPKINLDSRLRLMLVIPTKKHIQTIVKYHPNYKDWDYLFKQYKKLETDVDPWDGLRLWRFEKPGFGHKGKPFTNFIDLYNKVEASDEAFYNNLMAFVSKTKGLARNLRFEPGHLGYKQFRQILKRILPHIFKESEEVIKMELLRLSSLFIPGKLSASSYLSEELMKAIYNQVDQDDDRFFPLVDALISNYSVNSTRDFDKIFPRNLLRQYRDEFNEYLKNKYYAAKVNYSDYPTWVRSSGRFDQLLRLYP